MLVATSALAILQSFRESRLFDRGFAEYKEDFAFDLPLSFKDHTITLTDSLPTDTSLGQAERNGSVTIAIDGHPISSEYASIRPGQESMGRYHLWIEAVTFYDRANGQSVFLLAQRLQPNGHGRARVRVVTIPESGAMTLDTLPRYAFFPTYPRFRASQFVRDGAYSPFPFSVLDGFLFPLVFVVFPLGSLVVGVVLLRRAKAGSSAA